MIEEPYLAEDLGSDKIFVFSKSLISDKTEKWGDKILFLTQQENIQLLAENFNVKDWLLTGNDHIKLLKG
jgi:phage terminase large subunit